MSQPKDILVTTTSSLSNINVIKYLRPVSAHLVAGTGFGSDFLASFTDLVGGRSNTYQKQLTKLYNDAIANLKIAAFEIGANCILGLSIDMDEISGKGKAMFMLTATGTAVITEEPAKPPKPTFNGINLSNDGLEVLKRKKSIIDAANNKTLSIDSEIWDFISENQVYEIFPYVLERMRITLSKPEYAHLEENTRKRLIDYVSGFPEDLRWQQLCNALENENDKKIERILLDLVNSLQIVDLNKALELINSNDFHAKRKAVQLAVSNKAFYSAEDVAKFDEISSIIKSSMGERGQRTTQKGFLSKDKEVWTCECGKINFIDAFCSGCNKDIYGFFQSDMNPVKAATIIDEKISLITEYLKASQTI